jgi:hypothetical protein
MDILKIQVFCEKLDGKCLMLCEEEVGYVMFSVNCSEPGI